MDKMIFFVSYFPFPSIFLMALRSSFIKIFRKLKRKHHDGFYILLRCRSQKLRRFPGNFLEFYDPQISKATKQLFLSFFIFLLKLCNFSCFWFGYLTRIWYQNIPTCLIFLPLICPLPKTFISKFKLNMSFFPNNYLKAEVFVVLIFSNFVNFD